MSGAGPLGLSGTDGGAGSSSAGDPLVEALSLPTAEGHRLSAALHTPATAPVAASAGPLDGLDVVVCHPHPAFGGTQDTPLIVALARACCAAGARALRFDFRGVGGSTGTATGGLEEHRDVLAAIAELSRRGAKRVALVGYSFGALMAARAATEGEPPRALALIAPPTAIVADHADRVERLRAALASTRALVVAGTADPFLDAAHLRAWASATTELELLDGQGHFFTGPALDDLVARVLAFLVRCCADPTVAASAPPA